MRGKDMEMMDSKIKAESELKEQILTERDETFKKIKELEAKLLEKELESKEKYAIADQSIKLYEDMKKKYEDLIKKYDKFTATDNENKEKISELNKQIQDLSNFKGANENVIIIFNKLRSLMDTEPMFRVFGIVWDVGEINLSDLKNAIGIPTVTMKKYIATYEKFGILKVNDLGKVSLVDR